MRPYASPSSYKVSWDLQIINKTFSGKTTIDLTITAPTPQNCIQLHTGPDMMLNLVTMKPHLSNTTFDLSHSRNTESTERVILKLPEALEKGSRLELTLDFHAPLEDSLAGLYMSSYQDDSGIPVDLAVTQFEGQLCVCLVCVCVYA